MWKWLPTEERRMTGSAGIWLCQRTPGQEGASGSIRDEAEKSDEPEWALLNVTVVSVVSIVARVLLPRSVWLSCARSVRAEECAAATLGDRPG